MKPPGAPTSSPPAVADRFDVVPSAPRAHRLVAEAPPGGWTVEAALDVCDRWADEYAERMDHASSTALAAAHRATFLALGLPLDLSTMPARGARRLEHARRSAVPSILAAQPERRGAPF